MVVDVGTGIKGGDFVLSSYRVLLEMKAGMAWTWAAHNHMHCTVHMNVPKGVAR